MTVALLVNPAAGRGRATMAARRAKAQFASHGVDVRELVGSSAAESRDLAAQAVADGVDALVVVGGDGMIHLALPAVAGTGTPLGVIPAGTGNDQAREYGWPRRAPEAAADLVLAGVTRRVDVGEAVTADGRNSLFGSVLAAGFDSLVSDRTNRMRWPRGRARYNVAMLAEFANLRPLPFVLTRDDGSTLERELLLTAVGNTRSYGGGMRICPGADPADRRFDVTVVGPMTRRQLVRNRPRLADGTHVALPGVQVHRAARVELAAAGVTTWADGEPVGPLPATAECVPGALRLAGAGRA